MDKSRGPCLAILKSRQSRKWEAPFWPGVPEATHYAIFELPLVEFIFGVLLDSSTFYSSQKPEGRGVTGSLILINIKTGKKRGRWHHFLAGCLSDSPLLVQDCKDLETRSWKLECSFSNPIQPNNPSKNHCFFSKHFKFKTMQRTCTL